MQKKTLLITGCSSGIGYATALALQARGHRVIASCRKSSDQHRLESIGLTTILLDLNDNHSIDIGFEQAMELSGGKIDVLINNAGYGQAGAIEDLSTDLLKRQFQTNLFGLHELTRQLIPVMRQQGEGRIINISSILGLVSMPFRGAYNASKHALEAYSDSLRLELRDANIQVITLNPGPIDSRFRDSVVEGSLASVKMQDSHFQKQYQFMLDEFRSQKAESIFTCQPDAVIKKLIPAVEKRRPKKRYYVTFPAYFLMMMKRLLPTALLDRLMALISKKELKTP